MRLNYRSDNLKELRDQQVRFAPREKRIEQAARAERLIHEIDRDRTYPFDYVCYRVTDFRPDSPANAKVEGEDLLHDLRLLVEELSDSANIPVESAEERVLTVDELAEKFNVSQKTIKRWRDHGLVSRRFVIDGRKKLGFLESSVDRFVKANGNRVQRGAAFTHLTDKHRREIIDLARRMAATGSGPTEVSRQLADKTGRSVDTIRGVIRQFDQENPDVAVFPGRDGRLTAAAKDEIYRQFRNGVSVERLQKEFHRTKTTIYRIVNEVRAQRIQTLPLDFIPNPRFSRRGADKACLGDMPPAETATRKPRRPSGLPPYLASLYEMPLLTREQEQHLFRKYNYLKYKANKLRDQLDMNRPKSATMDEIEEIYEQIIATKNEIVRANLRLVVSIAKRHVGPDQNFFELVSDGNISLLRAVEKFDFARGNKFSTYASWAIMKNFARTIPGEYKHRDRFRTSHDELFAATQETRANPRLEESAQGKRETQISRILRNLDEREQRIIIDRYGLDHSQEPQTLKEVGATLGVTKERVRQLEARALNKLRAAAGEQNILVELE